ncbi:MAG: hypothetical protein JSS00_04440, partial [Proteobacteria bacterium]|nr:hypothetical protein [Pseudomonadota bacterium]
MPSNNGAVAGRAGANQTEVAVGTTGLPGLLHIPATARGMVAFAHGSGSSRFSPRNAYAAERMRQYRFGTLLFDLLTEREAQDRRNVFDIALLGVRVIEAVDWISAQAACATLPLGLFGASTGAAAAIVAAAARPGRVGAVVSRGGRPDMAGEALERIRAPTLLIVGGDDVEVLALNRRAARRM